MHCSKRGNHSPTGEGPCPDAIIKMRLTALNFGVASDTPCSIVVCLKQLWGLAMKLGQDIEYAAAPPEICVVLSIGQVQVVSSGQLLSNMIQWDERFEMPVQDLATEVWALVVASG